MESDQNIDVYDEYMMDKFLHLKVLLGTRKKNALPCEGKIYNPARYDFFIDLL